MKLEEANFLIVDDYESVVTMVASSLVDNGIGKQIYFANGGNEAISILQGNNQIGFIICDYLMPDLNGLAVLKWVRKRPEYLNVPFIMLTANQDRNSIMECLKEGASNYLVKPWSPDNLVSKIKFCWEKHR